MLLYSWLLVLSVQNVLTVIQLETHQVRSGLDEATFVLFMFFWLKFWGSTELANVQDYTLDSESPEP